MTIKIDSIYRRPIFNDFVCGLFHLRLAFQTNQATMVFRKCVCLHLNRLLQRTLEMNGFRMSQSGRERENLTRPLPKYMYIVHAYIRTHDDHVIYTAHTKCTAFSFFSLSLRSYRNVKYFLSYIFNCIHIKGITL